MDFSRILAELRQERALIEEANRSLEKLPRGRGGRLYRMPRRRRSPPDDDPGGGKPPTTPAAAALRVPRRWKQTRAVGKLV
jgi:hypothetical protein